MTGDSKEELILLGFEETFREISGLSLGQVRQKGRTHQIGGSIWKDGDTSQFIILPHASLSLGNGDLQGQMLRRSYLE